MQEFVFFHVMDSQELKLLCDEPLAEDKLVNLNYGTSTNLSKKEFKDCKTELLDKESKEFLFPDLLDRTWDELEGYKVELFDNKPVVQDKLVSLLHATNTDLDKDELMMKRSTSSYLLPRLTHQTICLFLVSPEFRLRLQLLLVEAFIQGERIMNR